MPIRKLRAGRVPGVTAQEYVGAHGTIFYDEVLGTLRISDGVTPYGQPLTLVGSDFQFQFGDFIATTPGNGAATLQSANLGQDIDIVSTDGGVINAIGNFHVHTTASYDPENPDANGAIFRVDQAGQVRMLVPTANSTYGAVEIIGSLSGEYQDPVNTGVMLHITGQLSDANRVYLDGNNSYSIIAGRRYNGTAVNPTAVLNNDIIVRYGANAYNGTAWNSGGVGRMEINATENHDASGQGTNIKFYTTTKRATSPTARLLLDEAGATIQGTGKFIGALTGNADTVTNGVYTSGDQTINGTKTFGSKITGSISGNADGTAAIATTVTLVATNSTAATHYLTFVDTATGNENVRTDTDLTYNPGTNTLFVPRLQSKLYRYSRDAGVIGAGGTLTLDFSVDDLVHCDWGDGMTLAYQNYTAGSVIRLMATKTSGGNNDPINLDGVTAANVSTGATVTANYVQGTTAFIEFTCINTTIGSVYVKL